MKIHNPVYLIFLVIMLVFVSIRVHVKVEKEHQDLVDCCPSHKWISSQTGLVCEVCKKEIG